MKSRLSLLIHDVLRMALVPQIRMRTLLLQTHRSTRSIARTLCLSLSFRKASHAHCLGDSTCHGTPRTLLALTKESQRASHQKYVCRRYLGITLVQTDGIIQSLLVRTPHAFRYTPRLYKSTHHRRFLSDSAILLASRFVDHV